MTKDPKSHDMQHEAADRAFVAGQHFSDFVGDHPFVLAHPDLAAKAVAIEELMAELYQDIWKADAKQDD